MKRKTTSVVSFFCGCGGLDLGFVGGFTYKGVRIPKQPIEMLAAYDYDEKCIETYKQNISDHAEVRDLSNYSAHEVPKADVLIGGFPCQDFATCGPRHGLSSTRGRLYQSLIQYMEIHSPKVVVGENVPGLANMEKGEVLEKIREDLSRVGYKVEVWTLFAPDYGVPQRRTRLFIIAVRDDIAGFPTKPRKSHSENTYRTTQWALEDLENVVDESIANQSQYFKASRAKNGNGQGDERNPADQPSYTIRANAKSRVQFHYALERRLTVRECARLQTFPDNFEFPHSATANVMQIGNAVPPLLGNKVAKSIMNFLENTP
ncbi:DNA cytosine methyltransferase [Pontiellaceae bacterium B12219]|nr:DNA cytosine methyltransferase [Pontiellaceae bacterium B12219]